MNTVDMTQYLKDGVALNLPGFDLAAMPTPDVMDQSIWEFVTPDTVGILRWPQEEVTKAGLTLPDKAREDQCVGWVVAVGPDCTRVRPGDCVTFEPLNFSTDLSLTTRCFPKNSETGHYPSEFGSAREKDLIRLCDVTRLPEEPSE